MAAADEPSDGRSTSVHAAAQSLSGNAVQKMIASASCPPSELLVMYKPRKTSHAKVGTWNETSMHSTVRECIPTVR